MGHFMTVSAMRLQGKQAGVLYMKGSIASLKHLRSLTLHGNPLEEKKHYRPYIIHAIPSLIQLDFSPSL